MSKGAVVQSRLRATPQLEAVPHTIAFLLGLPPVLTTSPDLDSAVPRTTAPCGSVARHCSPSTASSDQSLTVRSSPPLTSTPLPRQTWARYEAHRTQNQ